MTDDDIHEVPAGGPWTATLFSNSRGYTHIDPNIGTMVSLERWDLSGNLIRDLPPAIGDLPRLTYLDLTANRLRYLPSEIGKLQGLKELILRGNQLTELPQEIGALENLRTLDLRGNQLSGLPPSLGNLLRAGTAVFLDGNPLPEPFPELIARGADALATYLSTLLAGAVHQHEAKVVLIGEGNVGKTSLVAALLDQPFVDGRTTTHGIEVHPLKLPHPELDVKILLRLW